MKIITLTFSFLLFTSSFIGNSQNNPELIIIRWSTIDKGFSGSPYMYIIDESSSVQKIDIGRENLEEGETAILIHKKLKEYYSKGYKLISSNFSTTLSGRCDKGEYILQKE